MAAVFGGGVFATAVGERDAAGFVIDKLKGKFIVFDGPDGCGKSTQREMLGQRLTEAGLLEVRWGEGTFVAALTEEQLGAERKRLLDEAAASFARVAGSVAASREEAMGAAESMWDALNEGGRRKKS